jgi:DNA-binding NarL/FixJ family response regulator
VQLGFRQLLGPLAWVERCLAATSGAEALSLARAYAPHVALVDLLVADDAGVEICRALRAAPAAVRVILMAPGGELPVKAAQAAGASGVISKGDSPALLVNALQAVGRGGSCFGPDPGAPRPPARAPLSSRERNVLELVAAGATNREIATSLHISPHTVKQHTRALYRKLAVRNRTEAAHLAHGLGLVC